MARIVVSVNRVRPMREFLGPSVVRVLGGRCWYEPSFRSFWHQSGLKSFMLSSLAVFFVLSDIILRNKWKTLYWIIEIRLPRPYLQLQKATHISTEVLPRSTASYRTQSEELAPPAGNLCLVPQSTRYSGEKRIH